jgi:hypothetical protein
MLFCAVAAFALLFWSLGELFRLGTKFLHRNYCLHVGALLAVGGADYSGALVLLGVGACIDNLREACVVARLRWSATGRATADGQWGTLQVYAAWLACLAGLLLAVLVCALAPLSMLPHGDMLRWAAHVQRGVIPAVASEAGARGGLMSAAAVAFILFIELSLTWKSTAHFASAPRNRLRFRIAWPARMTFMTAVSVGMFYAFGVGPFGAGKLATVIGPDLWYGRLEVPAMIGFFLWGYYGTLTIERFNRSGRPRSVDLEGPSRSPRRCG